MYYTSGCRLRSYTTDNLQHECDTINLDNLHDYGTINHDHGLPGFSLTAKQ